MKTKKMLHFFILWIITGSLVAQNKIDTINALTNNLNITKLKESNQSYLVYFTDSTKAKRFGVGDIWDRSVKRIKHDNKDAIQFDWKWTNRDGVIKNATNICDAKTLKPISHFAINKTPNGIDTVGYVFENDFMIKDKSIKGNKVDDNFKLKLDIPVLNWELDLETYALLPIKKVGQIFDISFFDVSEKKAVYHRYEVVGEENFQLFNGVLVPCWLLKVNYDAKNSCTFWLTKSDKEMIKSEEKVVLPRGKMYSFKIKQFR